MDLCSPPSFVAEMLRLLVRDKGREYDRTKKEEVEIIERSVIKSSAVD